MATGTSAEPAVPTTASGLEQYADHLDFNKLYGYARPLDLLLFRGKPLSLSRTLVECSIQLIVRIKLQFRNSCYSQFK